MTHQKDLAGRKAIVTGSATGLGRSIALKLAERGADVIINCARSVEEGEATAADCQALGSQSRLVQADVSTDEGCRKLAD
ncbi:MAG: SDR family NAD(P)-dependent oxidoreductase, partial [Hyphomonas sp.]|nr:SDR family NAD(P)-dependent oxidoreductase [Hyphomonas sp.]